MDKEEAENLVSIMNHKLSLMVRVPFFGKVNSTSLVECTKKIKFQKCPAVSWKELVIWVLNWSLVVVSSTLTTVSTFVSGGVRLKNAE